jgi:glycosyltransferase involved in cell wall biosynthesis
VRFVVVGADAPPSVEALAGPDIVIAGHVPEIEPVFDRSRVLVAPLRYGAGLKGKIGQSLAYGLPLVTTAVGAEGMDLVDGEHALLAEEPAAFADAVVRLYEDPVLWARLAAAGRRHVDARFGPAAVRDRLAAALAAATRARAAS